MTRPGAELSQTCPRTVVVSTKSTLKWVRTHSTHTPAHNTADTAAAKVKSLRFIVTHLNAQCGSHCWFPVSGFTRASFASALGAPFAPGANSAAPAPSCPFVLLRGQTHIRLRG